MKHSYRIVSLTVLVCILLTACAAKTTLIPITSTIQISATSLPSPTPEPTTVPQLSNLDMKTALGDAPYTVAADGNAQITTKDTNQNVEIVKAAVVNTDFGLANHIITGFDKENNRYVYTEGYGWVKDINAGTPEQRTQVPYEWFGANVVNTLASLHYQDNPTIPPNAITPQWWLKAGGSQEIGGYDAILSLIPNDTGLLFQNGNWTGSWTKSTKPYGSPVLWLEFSKDGKGFVTAVQPNKNPTLDNKKQLINMNWTFDQDTFDQKQVKGVTPDFAGDMTNDSMSFQALIAADPSRGQVFNRATYLIGPDGIFSTPTLQQPGEQLSLFSKDDQSKIITAWQEEALVPWGRISSDKNEFKITSIPKELALKCLTADETTYPWGDIQP